MNKKSQKCEQVENLATAKKAEHCLHKKFAKTIWNKFGKALDKYKLLKENDKVAVCISGGKDSMLMAKLFQELQKHSKYPFELEYIVMDPGYSKQNLQKIKDNACLLGLQINIFQTNIFAQIESVKKYPCFVCARMRRGALYAYAQKLGCNKIALGHHYDDVIETILMGMLYSAQIQTMMPKLRSKNFEGMELIRPLYLIREKDIIAWAKYNNLQFIECACKFTEQNTAAALISSRQTTKALIQNLKQTIKDVEAHIFRSVENVNVDAVVGYKQKNKKHSFLDFYDET